MLAQTLKRLADKLYDWSDKLAPDSYVEELTPVTDTRQETVMIKEKFDDQQALEDVKDDPFSYQTLIDYHKYKPKHFGNHKSYLDEPVPEKMITEKSQRRASSYGGEATLW